MSDLQISEYVSVQSTVQGDIIHIPQVPPIATQTLNFTNDAPVDSVPFNKDTRFIRVATDASNNANVAFGKGASPEGTPQAGAQHDLIPADAVAFFGINPDLVDRLNVS